MSAPRRKNISEKAYLPLITFEDLSGTIAKFDLSIEVVVEDGMPKLLFDPKYRWEILNLIDDSYLGSEMTGYRYEANSKREL